MVFRAVPVSVVAESTLSMSAKATATERGRSPVRGEVKSAQSVKDAKKSFEAKAQEVTATTTGPLNRALQPRGSRQAAAGSKPKESGARPKESDDKPKSAVAATGADKKKMGALTGSQLLLQANASFPSWFKQNFICIMYVYDKDKYDSNT